MKNQKQQIDVEVNSKQAKHLQSLGLRYLLQTAFPKTLKAVWRQAWLNRITVGLVILGVYSITMTVVAVGYKKDLRKLDFSDDKNNQSKPPFQLGLTDEEMTQEIVRTIGEGGDINKLFGSFGATIFHKSMNREVPTEFLDFIMERGADINIQRKSDGNTPLMAGLHRDATQNVLYLIMTYPEKIDFSIKNERGNTLYDCALLKLNRRGGGGNGLREILALSQQ